MKSLLLIFLISCSTPKYFTTTVYKVREGHYAYSFREVYFWQFWPDTLRVGDTVILDKKFYKLR